jgi:MoaA/NifB/PqqE/SkfB family radical SAM enzyme
MSSSPPPLHVPAFYGPDAVAWAEDLRLSLADGVVRRPPLAATFTLTARCNLSCTYCPYGQRLFPFRDDSLARDDVWRLSHSLAQAGVRQFQLSGGEALLVPYLAELVELATTLGVRTVVVTNGTLLTRELFRTLRRAGLDSLVVSIDGSDDEAHARTRGSPLPAACEWLADECGDTVWLGANVTLTRDNAAEIEGLAQWLRARGFVPQVQPVHGFTAGIDLQSHQPDLSTLSDHVGSWIKAAQHAPLLNNSPEYLHGIGPYLRGKAPPLQCYIPWIQLFVAADGQLHTCCNTDPIGNISEHWESAWHGPKARLVRQECWRGCSRCWLGLVDFWKHNRPKT